MKPTRVTLLLIVALAATVAQAQNNIPQVQHVIVVIQENRTPTNVFHEDANLVTNGAHVIPPNNQAACGDKPMPPPSSKGCVNATKMSGITLTGLPLNTPVDPDHSHYPAWYCTYDGGKMDGACHIPVSQSGNVSVCPEGQLQYCPYSYVQNIKPPNCRVQPCPGILDPYFHVAEQFGFANWMFQTNQGPSQPAHLFLFSGTSAPDFVNDQNCTSAGCWEYFVAENGPGHQQVGCTAPANTVVYELPPAPPQNPAWQQGYTPPGGTAGYPCYYSYDLVDLLGTKISWRYYNASGTGGFNYWNAPNMKHDICNPSPTNLPGDVCNYPPNVKQGNPGLALNDLGASGTCDLQQVTWVIPDGDWSDHPGTGSYDGGPSWVAAIVNGLGGYTNFGAQFPVQCTDTINGQKVPYWQDTVVLVVWDDWGGFYDDVLPWGCNSQGVCSGYPGQPQSAQYVYGFRVPLLVVGAYVNQVTPQGGYISGACTPTSCQAAVPYVHDFGSILNFIEAVFGLGEISPDYHYADFLAPDVFTSGNCTKSTCPYGLSDFFNFGQSPRPFALIQGAKYDTGAFLDPTNYFPNYPEDPDDDAIDPQ